MEHWHLFSDPRFTLRFRYPATTPQGHTVEKLERHRDDALRVHVLSRQSDELYFEVTKFFDLPPQEEYRRHKAYLEERFAELTITELRETRLGSLPAYSYTFTWPDNERAVVLIDREQATYRILYNPRAALNAQVLATVEFPE